MEKRPTAVSWHSLKSRGTSAFFRTFLVVGLLGWFASCGGDSTSGPNPDDTKVSTVSVTPGTNSLTFVGETAQLSAAAKNSSGNAVSGTTYQWSSSSSTVVAVSGAGLVTAIGNGTATITATANGSTVRGTAQVTVQQAVAEVTVSPQDGSIEVGETVQLSVNATDAGGADVESATFTWGSSDDAIATVSSGGLVSGRAGGAVTISATAGGSEGTAPVTVTRVDLDITQDSNLSGTYLVDEFTIPAGVTVTATDDLTIDATGYVEILGTITGDCVAVTVQGDTAVTVMGTINNGCTAGGDGEDLTIGADGELILENATITSSGEMDFSNDPTLTDDDFPAPGPALLTGGQGSERASTRNGDGPFRAGPGIRFTRVDRTTVRYLGGATGPSPADPGTNNDNGDGGNGRSGRKVAFRLRGNAEFIGGNTLWAQDGGKGGYGIESKNSDVVVKGGAGGNGGDIRILVTGTLLYSGAENIVRSGNAGDGGNATGVGENNDDSARAPGAKATGGKGGEPGLMDIRAGGGITIVGGTALVLEIGKTGHGGNATATGDDGANATTTKVAQHGGDAEAIGGEGGSTPDRQLVKQGSVTGSPVIRGSEGSSVEGGNGGEAQATAGDGGRGEKPNKDGGSGGAIKAQGGKGGDYGLKNLLGEKIGDGGNGGKATLRKGNGGAGWDDCIEGQPPEDGGKGGDGGAGSGGGGAKGIGKADGDHGKTVYVTVGNGGNGGKGDGKGMGGAKGGRSATELGGTEQTDPIFKDGDEGDGCPVIPPVQAKVDFSQVQNSGGLVTPNVPQTVPLNQEGGGVTGTMQMTPLGVLGALFWALSPEARVGVQGGEGNGFEFDFQSIVLQNAEAVATGVTLCFVNTFGVSSSNPIRLVQLNALREIIKETLVNDPEFNSCSEVALEPTARFIFVTVAIGAVFDLLGPVVALSLL